MPSVFNGSTFKGSTILIDGTTFERCTFVQTTLVYAGGDPPIFVKCNFDHIGLEITGSAANTLKYLSNMYSSPFKSYVEELFDDIRNAKVVSAAAIEAAASSAQSKEPGE